MYIDSLKLSSNPVQYDFKEQNKTDKKSRPKEIS
jgi:hypothetical protein